MSYSLGVVPIFVNAGAAVLPAVVGALASFLSLLLRPRMLIQAIIRRPLVAGGVVGGGVLVGLAIWWACLPAKASGMTDWVKVATDILRREQAGGGLVDPMPTSAAGATVLGHDFARCGHDGAGGPLGLKLLWQHRPESAMFLSSPAVAGGKVYGGLCIMDIVKTGEVVCLDASTGRVVWRTTSAGQQPFKPFFSSPAITKDGRNLLIGQGLHDDADCSLLCLDTRTGQVRWQVPTPLHIEGSPAVLDDLVVAGAGAIEGPDHTPTSHIGMVVAVRISDGKELWRYDVNDPESSPAIAPDGTVYIGSGFNGSAVVALRSQGDAELKAAGLPRLVWRTASPYPMTGAITLVGDTVVAGGGNGDYVVSDPHPAGVAMALDRKSGAVKWQRPMEDAVLGHLAVSAGRVLCPVRNGEVVALDLASGQVLWRQRVSGTNPVLSGCAVAGEAVYAVSRDGFLAVLDARTGRIVEKHYINDEKERGKEGLCLSSPRVAMRRVFVGSETGGLECFVGTKVSP